MGEPHVLSALIAKRAELAGEIDAAERRADQLRADLIHVDAVLRLFDPAAVPEAIPAKRVRRSRRRWFSDGELPRRILEALRTAPEPLSPSDIARQVMAAKGIPAGDEGTFLAIRKCVQHYLTRQRGKLVEPAGRRGKDGLWRVMERGRLLTILHPAQVAKCSHHDRAEDLEKVAAQLRGKCTERDHAE